MDYRWCFDAIRHVARQECSIVAFDVEAEQDPDVLKYVLKSVRRAPDLARAPARPAAAAADDDDDLIPF